MSSSFRRAVRARACIQALRHITTHTLPSQQRDRTCHMQGRVARARVGGIGVRPAREQVGHRLRGVTLDEAMQGGVAVLLGFASRLYQPVVFFLSSSLHYFVRTSSRMSSLAPRASSRGSTDGTASGWLASRCRHPDAAGAACDGSSRTARVTPVVVCVCPWVACI